LGRKLKYLFTGLTFLLIAAVIYSSQNAISLKQNPDDEEDTSYVDTLANTKAVGPQFKLKPDPAFPHGELKQSEGIQLREPSNVKSDIQYDPLSKQYTIKSTIGNFPYRPASTMSLKEYRQYEMQRSTREYWQEQASSGRASGQKGIRPTFNVGGETFDKIFGSSAINIVPQGQAELIFMVNISTSDNPYVQENLRTVPSFNFDEKIQMNVTGTIGDRMKLTLNYNTEATFEFENKTKLEYTGDEDDIIKKIEAGDVTLPLQGSLITGSQSLFGIKTELQFGKLTATTVFSQQKGQSQVVQLQGGAQVTDFEISIDDYQDKRHFFLAHYFADNYDKAHEYLPKIASNITITRIEVWTTNLKGKAEEARDVVGFVDLGENNKDNLASDQIEILKPQYPSNESNTLYAGVKDAVQNGSYGKLDQNKYVYEVLNNARKLSPTDYTVDLELGYISLNTSFDGTEILAVAYEYKLSGGGTYRVGQLSSDNTSSQPLALKLLKGKIISPKSKTWDLMMKNIYSLGAYDLSNDNFYLNIMYHDDSKGSDINYIPENAGNLNTTILLRVFNLDKVNSQLQQPPDGVFDFIDGITIDRKLGRIIFPSTKPFGKFLYYKMKKLNINDTSILKKYVFNELYDSTQTKAKLMAEKNKFKLKGSYKSASSSEIYLNASNIPKGSVRVTSGGIPLREGIDYTVDYTMGTVKIINSAFMESGQPLQVSLENNSMFNIQTKTMIGTHLDYKFSDDFNLGGTILYLNERPLTKKVNIGDEPISNTIWGLNSTYRANSQFLTTLVDKLPLLQTKEISTITLTGEFAQLIPGSSSAIGKNGVAYIDDFEASETPYDLKYLSEWRLASSPYFNREIFPAGTDKNDTLSWGYKRARISWYVLDPLFYANNSSTPEVVKSNPEMRSSHYVRGIFEQELFPKREAQYNQTTFMQILNLTYYPYLKGPYNFDTNIDYRGNLNDPSGRWGGIMKKSPVIDFEAANVEYIEFWMMDPFVEDSITRGGQMYIDLGSVSEDVLTDGRMSMEQGLPCSSNPNPTIETAWGRVPGKTMFSQSFISIQQQDLGLDGLSDAEEDSFPGFKKYLSRIDSLYQFGLISDTAYYKLTGKKDKDPDADISNDNFRYFLDSRYDRDETGIIDRYMNYNGTEANSQGSTSSTPRVNYTNPDMEDNNDDNTLNTDENYYEYKVDLKPGQFKIGNNFIADVRGTKDITFPNGSHSPVNWYQFKIPVTDFSSKIGKIEDFTSISFIRVYFAGFERKTTFRFATFDLVRGEWRKYLGSLVQGELTDTRQPGNGLFDIQAVNIEENSNKSPVNYVLPPGIDRVIDPNQEQLRQLNEQSMVLKVEDLEDGDARAAYKTTNIDMRQYKMLRMFTHCESLTGKPKVYDNDLTVFIRIGSDFKNNYYEYEVPMKVTNTDNGSGLAVDKVWMDANTFNINLELLQKLKQERNNNHIQLQVAYPGVDGKNKMTVCGNPSLSAIKAIMIGVRNPNGSNSNLKDKQAKSAEIWIDELRLTDFSDKGGWAANARAQVKLADFGNVRVSGSTMRPGFGSIEKKVNDREKAQTDQYDVATDLELGKFFPEKAQVRIPMYASYSQTLITPEYNPYDPDIKLKTAISAAETQKDKDQLQHDAEDKTVRRSINFTNVKVNKTSKKPQFYDPANFAVSYGYNDVNSHNPTVASDYAYTHEGGLSYIFNLRPKNVTPLRNISYLKYKPLRLIQDFNFNYAPSSVSVSTNVIRTHRKLELRNLNSNGISIPPSVEKNFGWTRNYDVKYDLTRGLKVDFNANAIAQIEELPDDSTYESRKRKILKELSRGGHMRDYNQVLNATYTIPVNKLPMLDWVSSTARYSGRYEWTYQPDFMDKDSGMHNLGNVINNSRNTQLSVTANLNTIYNKFKIIKDLTDLGKKGKEKPKKTVTFEKRYFNLKAATSKSITHRLGTEDVTVTVKDEEGNNVKGQVDVASSNRVTFTPDSDINIVYVKVEGKVDAPQNLAYILTRNTVKILTGVRSISGTYGIVEGTTLPGYAVHKNDFAHQFNETEFFGSTVNNGKIAPGVGFILGNQDMDIIRTMDKKGWLVNDPLFNSPVLFTNNKTLNIRVDYQPLDGLRIDLNANHSYTRNTDVYYSYNSTGNIELSRPTRKGSFSMTIISLGSFDDLKVGSDVDKNDFRSTNFRKFMDRRADVQVRLEDRARHFNSYRTIENSQGFVTGYGELSQQVLIPTFLSVYGGYNINTVPLNLFPGFLDIRPNWRVSYDGLSNLPYVEDYARSVTLNHSYTSTYNIGSYISNFEYEPDLVDGFSTTRDLMGNFFPIYDVGTVTINEQFSPWFGVDVTWKNNLTTRFEYKKSRMIQLLLTNSSLNESRTFEYVFGVGYRFEKVPLQFISLNGGQSSVESDLNVRGDVSLREDYVVLRSFAQNTEQATQGNQSLKISLSADYNLSQNLTLRLFFDRTLSLPYVRLNNSYKTINTEFGFSVRFSLTQ
jgi:cell surface protein SprA